MFKGMRLPLSRLLLTLLATSVTAASACGSDAGPTAPALPVFDAASQLDVSYTLNLFGGSGQWDIRLDAVLRNVSGTTRVLSFSGCPLQLEAYATPAGTGTAAWSSTSAPGGCKTPRTDTIASGDSLKLSLRTNTTEILTNYGDASRTNQPGQYFFFASLNSALAASTRFRQLVGFAELK